MRGRLTLTYAQDGPRFTHKGERIRLMASRFNSKKVNLVRGGSLWAPGFQEHVDSFWSDLGQGSIEKGEGALQRPPPVNVAQ